MHTYVFWRRRRVPGRPVRVADRPAQETAQRHAIDPTPEILGPKEVHRHRL